MATRNAADVAAKWSRNLQASTQDIIAGVNAVTQAPGAAAARNKDAWAQKVLASKDKWARNVAAVSLEDWKSKMIDVGVGRIAGGAVANQPKMERFLGAFLPYQEQGRAKVAQMPNATLQDGIARMVAMVQHAAAFPGVNR